MPIRVSVEHFIEVVWEFGLSSRDFEVGQVDTIVSEHGTYRGEVVEVNRDWVPGLINRYEIKYRVLDEVGGYERGKPT